MPHTTPPMIWLRAVLGVKDTAGGNCVDDAGDANNAQLFVDLDLGEVGRVHIACVGIVFLCAGRGLPLDPMDVPVSHGISNRDGSLPIARHGSPPPRLAWRAQAASLGSFWQGAARPPSAEIGNFQLLPQAGISHARVPSCWALALGHAVVAPGLRRDRGKRTIAGSAQLSFRHKGLRREGCRLLVSL
jgi:hypothetical protein